MTESPGKGDWFVRSAVDGDQPAISRLVRSERLFPYGLGWRTFVVAEAEGRIVGAAQVRNHGDGSRELGSLVVAQAWRSRGIGEAMIVTLLARETGPVHLVTSSRRAPRFARLGFRSIRPSRAPISVRRHFWLGQVGGGLSSLFSFRRPQPMVVMRREGTKRNP